MFLTQKAIKQSIQLLILVGWPLLNKKKKKINTSNYSHLKSKSFCFFFSHCISTNEYVHEYVHMYVPAYGIQNEVELS